MVWGARPDSHRTILSAKRIATLEEALERAQAALHGMLHTAASSWRDCEHGTCPTIRRLLDAEA